MKAMEPRLTRAVVEWTGWGRSPRPDRDDARVIARFGREAGPALAKAARRLEADYSSGSAEFRSRHPELGGDAVDALAWSTANDRGSSPARRRSEAAAHTGDGRLELRG